MRASSILLLAGAPSQRSSSARYARRRQARIKGNSDAAKACQKTGYQDQETRGLDCLTDCVRWSSRRPC